MNVGDEVPDAASPREGLAAQLRQLEEFVARTESDGGELPPEAVTMVARLREIMEALEGLSTSLEGLDMSVPTAPSASTGESS